MRAARVEGSPFSAFRGVVGIARRSLLQLAAAATAPEIFYRPVGLITPQEAVTRSASAAGPSLPHSSVLQHTTDVKPAQVVVAAEIFRPREDACGERVIGLQVHDAGGAAFPLPTVR